ncbi:hypothetical protein [Novosphingobium cyanobacteriorum]|uniref:Uncharacterized protein n=1 Tax=Novosphingobium cyanobacteriorum TaxID=3024215 RepID=A0ABT6CME9_9SPHN|nr:hypothetical protein [Novosphingobium cyanobacteriorum]MDF8335094.1 hypothetical protein [Novosphingobium cyanobacteriorum]
MKRGPIIAVAPDPAGFRVLATDAWRGLHWPKPGEVLTPFVALHYARKAAEAGGRLHFEIVPDGKPYWILTVAERDEFQAGGQDQ